MQATTEQEHRLNPLLLYLAVRKVLMSGPAPVLYPGKDKHNSNALPGLSYLLRQKTKPQK